VRVLPHGRGHTVAVIGVGYVGLPTAATLAHLGPPGDRAAMPTRPRWPCSRQGKVPIVEDHLEDLVREGQAAGRLRFVVGATAAAEGAEFVFLCVPTPQGDDGSADLSYVEAVAEEIGPLLLPGTIIVNKSTVPVGSTLVVERVLGRHDITVVSNPEFLREGTAVSDSLHPERIVVGADDQAAAAKVGDLFAGTHAPLLITDAATAETIKYASNAFLATKLSFVNAVAGLCEAVGADVRDVILGLGYDKRIGFEYLRPGPGWGGSCLPKDTRALVHIAEQAGYDFSFLKGAIATNDEQFVRVVDKVRSAVGGKLSGSGHRGVGAHLQGGDRRPAQLARGRGRPAPGGGGAVVRAFDPTVSVPAGQKSVRSTACRHGRSGTDAGPDRAGPCLPDAYCGL
jgi:UDPglucose 6-dehydrogenase